MKAFELKRGMRWHGQGPQLTACRLRGNTCMSETDVKRAILEALKLEPGLRVWRNNVGTKGHVHYGLGPGSADIIGCLCVDPVFDPRHGTSLFGRFVSLEVKRDAKRKPEAHQSEWLEYVRLCGGFAAVVWDVPSARAAIARARRGESR